jgi:hypothetical protein
MSYAICIACGSRKGAYAEACPSCGNLPVTDNDVARSLILSSDFKLDSLNFPKTDEELLDLSKSIAMGQLNVVSDHDIEIVKAFLADMVAFQRRWSFSRGMLFWVLPVLLLLVFVGYVFKVIIST